ncbi:MAG: metallophosphoesterase [Pseudomonadota bacterium]
MFKLAHISDLHLPIMPSPSWSQLANKRILGYLNWKRNRSRSLGGNYLESLLADLPSKAPDHLVVSGDIVNLALPGEIENAAKFLPQLGSSRDVSVICGNHDAYVRGGLEMAIEHWRPFMSGDGAEALTTKDFPYLRVRSGVAIIGCNSAEPTAPFMATGYFRSEQAERLARVLKETQDLCRVVCIHHPPIERSTAWYKRLIGDHLFRKVVAESGAELVLHGHTHLATTNFIERAGAKIPVICVPAAGNSEGGHRPAGRYNLFSLDKSDGGWSILHEAYGFSESEKRTLCLEKQLFQVNS